LEEGKTMKEIDRRAFIKTATTGAAGVYLAAKGFGAFGTRAAQAAPAWNFGEIKSLKIRCVSETGWWSTPKLLQDIKQSGGAETSQYQINWDKKNEGAYSALIEAEELDGKIHKFLLDTGWNQAYTDWCFQREGIDQVLRKNGIEFLYISHEHIDHFWGLPVACKYRPDIKLVIPSTFYPEGHEFIKKSGHKGEVVQLAPGKSHPLFPGCVSVTFDIPILIRVRGEQVLYFNVKNKGLVIVTGCCHPTINSIIDYADQNLKPEIGYYGLYGGLHIALMENWNPQFDKMIESIQKAQFHKIGSNHCTGFIAVNKMTERNLPVVKGTASYGSKSDLYVGNGDEIVFSSVDLGGVG
jgi:7,8-dihydropterin-6-yl-methyl-4-(beta-D-ribofuranosyl)aminobenzene 5'-phosphate synthase